MKRSERLIRVTILALAALVAAHVGVSRLNAAGNPAQSARRTSAATLATLQDFDTIEVNGAFSVEVVRDQKYSIAFTPDDATEGRFFAAVHDRKLVLVGVRNMPGSRVRVGMPTLTRLNVERALALSLSGFDGGALSLQLGTIGDVTLRNNTVRQWHIETAHAADLKIDRTSISAGKVDLTGHAVLTVID